MTELLTKETFLKKVFNFEKNKEWNEYKGKVDIYKVDTEAEQELSAAFGIRSIPSMLFCPADEQPQMAQGALPKHNLEQVIKDVLKVEK